MPGGTLISQHNNNIDHGRRGSNSATRSLHTASLSTDSGKGEKQGQNSQNGDSASDHEDGPPPKRRKVADQTITPKALFRPVSPPWKRVTIEGPTSFMENGRRKSGRTNVIPLELQPQSDKRQTRAAIHKEVEDKAKHNRLSYSNPAARPRHENSLPKRPISAEKATPNGPGRPPSTPRSPVLSKAALSKPSHSLLKSIKQPYITARTQPRDDRTSSKSFEVSAVTPANDQRQQDTPASIPPEQPQDIQMNGYDAFRRGVEESPSASVSRSPSPPVRLQKIKFRVQMPKLAVQSPANIPLPKNYASFQEFLEKDPNEPIAGQDLLDLDQIKKEASVRRRVRQAQRRGGVLHKKILQALPEKPKDPRLHFAHYDHLLAHVCHFRHLLNKEHQAHKRHAKKVVEEVAKYVERRRLQNKTKTEEEIVQEEIARTQNKCRHVVRALEQQWTLVDAEVKRFRMAQWEEHQRTLGKARLDRVLEENAEMLRSRMVGDSSESEAEVEADIKISYAEHTDSDNTHEDDKDDKDDEDDKDESNMSSSGSESDVSEVEDGDADLTAEQLKMKYANIPRPSLEREIHIPERLMPGTSQLPTRESPHFEHQNMNEDDDTDPSIDMDSVISTGGKSDTDDKDNTDEEEDSGDDSDTQANPLFALFSREEISQLKSSKVSATASSPNIDQFKEEDVGTNKPETTDADGPVSQQPTRVGESAPISDSTTTCLVPASDNRIELHASVDVSTQPSPHTSATKASEVESFSSVDPRGESPNPASLSEVKIKTPVPSLLRGTLRAYQHFGLDWLAEQYYKGRNGILADEMGLGKTLQSIALLAHLAEVHHVWGPHLIIVPTSVMLNWEMEFKKFCPGFKVLTYYGTQEERKLKRRGWQSDRPWHVLITSYQLILQDQTVFKRYKWHYMILDEAHNIKNFHSQRWQTMLTFKTHARLLLTGTPLQNNLMELWSLLFFLRPSDTAEDEEDGFAGLKEFSDWFRNPVNKILEHGRDAMSNEDRAQVIKLHHVIRPYILRRLKADVEKQMPAKYEHIELCRLSKRQRQLYDGFLCRAQTKETLASGNYLSIINCLMQLRKVCNHPDLFETRPITTSFAMARSAAADFEIQDLLVRRHLLRGKEEVLDLDFLQLAPISRESKSHIDVLESGRLNAIRKLQYLRDIQCKRANWDMHFNGSSTSDVLTSIENVGRRMRMAELDRDLYFESQRHCQRPIYGQSLLDKLSFGTASPLLSSPGGQKALARFGDIESFSETVTMVKSYEARSVMVQPLILNFGCSTPAVVATDLAGKVLSDVGVNAVREAQAQWPTDLFHEAQTRLSIAFPDKRLLQYDCGKLQRLDRLLRELQAGGHRALIFTQMTKVLDILEQFLNIHGHRYLRLDGATKIEQRQILTDRFNNDTRILAFILSSRSGGLGINLTGADTVIFYDLDWNPAMDKQCQDRCHRIGQTRDVHIYRFVSEHTIEANILRKSNQKRMLDDVIIQEGDFTTEYFSKVSVRDVLDDEIGRGDEACAAMDRVLGNEKGGTRIFGQVEDKEDIAAAEIAEEEVQHVDDGDFDDGVASSHDASATPRTNGAPTPGGPVGAPAAAVVEDDAPEDDAGHIDNYMIRLQEFLLKDVPIMPDSTRNGKAKKKGGEHRLKRIR